MALTLAACSAAPGGVSGNLTPGTVPAAYVTAVQAAGAVCPEIPAPIIAAQIQAESAWNPTARSPVGALGMAQFMPGTWASWGTDGDHDGKADPFNPLDAIASQAAFDCSLAGAIKADVLAGKLKGSVTELVLAAYNAGLGAVRKNGGIPPFAETQAYVPRIMQGALRYGLTVGAAPGTPGAPVEATGTAAAVIAAGRRYLGTPYEWGGGSWAGPSSRGGFDCSGFTQYAYYAGAGIKLPRTAATQSGAGVEVPREQIRPGDIITFTSPGSSAAHHVGIYVGNNQLLHAPQTGDVVKVSNLSTSYWEGQLWHIRRVLN